MELNNLVHKPARLVIPKNKGKWYIIMYIYDVQCGQVKRKRFYQLPEGDNIHNKEFLARQICKNINSKLKEGYVADKEALQDEKTAKQKALYAQKLYISAAIMRIVRNKRYDKERTEKTYLSIATVLHDWLNKLEIAPSVETFHIGIAKKYLSQMLDDGKSPRTYNNHLLTLRTLWQEGIEEQIFTSNPWKSIPRLKTAIGKNIAYLPNQQKEIIDFAHNYPTMLFLIRFMYYTLARTNEIGHLQVKHIGMYTPDKIYLPASVSKNNIERHIIIPPGLEKEIEKFDIRNKNPEWYLFSKNKLQPGPHRMDTRAIGCKYRRWITSKLNYHIDYTLYSWKHTGVIAAHKAGVSDDDIMMQTGHKDYGSFQKYLKSLSLYDNKDFALKIPEI